MFVLGFSRISRTSKLEKYREPQDPTPQNPLGHLGSALRYWTLINPLWDLQPVDLLGLWAHLLNWLCLLLSSLDPDGRVELILDQWTYDIWRHMETHPAHGTHHGHQMSSG